MKTKAQAWGMDLIIGLTIFLLGIVVFYIYSLNAPNEVTDTFEKLNYDGKIILNNLFSEGYPLNWDMYNVIEIGLLTENKIDNNKIEEFYNFVNSNYSKTKNLLNTRYEYYFFLSENMTIDGTEVEGIGKPGIDPQNIYSSNLIKITRFSVYNEKPVTAYLYIWEE